MNRIIAVVGPTASGKTELAIGIAREFDGEIVSCDSMQIYKYMNIGSAKPSDKQLKLVKHHLIGTVDPSHEMSCATFRKMAGKAIDEVISRRKLPVICGGTGLYIDSLIYDMDFAGVPGTREEREELYAIAEREGKSKLYDILKELDPESAKRIHPNNVKRVVRAIEAAKSGNPIGNIKKDLKQSKEYDPVIIGICRNREALYETIDKRVDAMVEKGLKDEVMSLMKMGLTSDTISMMGIGYKEMIAHINGEYDLSEAIRLIKRNTRHYAKRQITWLKKYKDAIWFNADDYDDQKSMLEDVIECLRRKL